MEILEPKQRREWAWTDSNLPEKIMIKKEDATIEHMFADDIEQSSLILIPDEDKFKKWKWSESFEINQLGIMTIEVKKVENRFNNLKARKIIKIVKKQIDVSSIFKFHRLQLT